MSTTNSAAPAVVRRKVDDRVKALIQDAAEQKHRAVILLVGDRAKDQIVNLHLMASRANHTSKLSLLWCMKDEVDFGSTSRKRQERVARLEVKGGMSTETTKEAFQTFLQQTQIRYCQYKETHKILGQTFGMAVLQDFEALTPNVLARTVETVAGGGLIVLMLRAMRSLRQLYTLAMDVHSRFRTDAHHSIVPRFNERFLLSLADCPAALCVDDELTVLPITSQMKAPVGRGAVGSADDQLRLQGRLQHEAELLHLKTRLKSSSEVGPLVQICQTVDQAKTVLALMQVIAEKSLNATCAVTAARGRGKSAALGLAAAGAVAQGYSNIFCTAPSPENLGTFFEFAVKALQELGYRERVDFEAMQSTNPDFHKCVIRINVFRGHRQTIQFISAGDSAKFGQAELLIVDEAAAIPLPLVRKMLGPYLVLLSSTVSGYEGTGRALSMKLVADMRRNAAAPVVCAVPSVGSDTTGSSTVDHSSGRVLRELQLSDPIRYGPNDPVEAWLNVLLCLDATNETIPAKACPHPSACDLYYINRDALFSYHPSAERLLHRVMALLVAAHYKNQPNDLQLMSDAPGHHLFVLCGPVTSSTELPDIYCVVHACEEGKIASATVEANLSRGHRPSGDLIPYTIAQYYLEEGFASLGGLRIIRIATHPDFQRAGFGSRALHLLREYYSGNIAIETVPTSGTAQTTASVESESDGPIGLRSKIPALLTPLHERPFEVLDYLGVSFGATNDLFNFWKKGKFCMVYLRQVPNDITGEHSCVMIQPLGYDLKAIQAEFRHRFLVLLSQSFRDLPVDLALSIVTDLDVHVPHVLAAATVRPPPLASGVAATSEVTLVDGVPQVTFHELATMFSVSDLRRMQLCSTAYVDNSVVWDLVPALARLYFSKRCFLFPDGSDGVVLSHAHAAVLLAVGLQCRSIDDVAATPTFSGIPAQQLRAFLNKALSRLVEHIHKLRRLVLDNDPPASRKKQRMDTDGDASIAEGAGESDEVEERYDASGNVTGIVVKRRVERTVDVDSTLRRHTRDATGISHESSDRDSSHRQQSGANRMKMSKKTRR